MNKKILTMAGAAGIVAFLSLGAGEVFAADITVTCDNDDCVMLPEEEAALFDETELDNTTMLPGDAVQRTIDLINNGDDTCYMYLEETIPTDKNPDTFPNRIWTALLTSEGAVFGGITAGEANATANLQDLFDQIEIPVEVIPAGEQKQIQWLAKFDPTAGNEFQRAEVWFDFKMTFGCGPEFETQDFTVSKNNTSWPERLVPGDIASFQITVATQNLPVFGVTVIDLPADSVTYVAGSGSASSNLRGPLNIQPSYTSPGIWELGDMEANEIITLTYNVKVNSTATNGIYKDLAWAYGFENDYDQINGVIPNGDFLENGMFPQMINGETSGRILALSTDSSFEIDGGVVTNTFVGTQIAVNQRIEAETTEVTVEVDETEEVTDVLGVAVQILPATGGSLLISVLLVLFGITGFLLFFIPFLKDRKATRVLSLLIVGIFTILMSRSVLAQQTSLYLRVSEPDSPINQAFVVDYVALDIEDRTVEVTCEIKNPDSTFFESFAETDLGPGGDSGTCNVTAGMLEKEGTYVVRVTAENSLDQQQEEVAVVYKSTGPTKPSYVEKNKINNCEYDIKVRTSSDNRNAYVEVYRSDKREFKVGTQTRIRTIDMGPNETYEFTHKLYGGDCGNSYYAARAFDEAGNYSEVTTEVVERTVVVERVIEPDSPEAAILLAVEDGESTEEDTVFGPLIETEVEVVIDEEVEEPTEVEEGPEEIDEESPVPEEEEEDTDVLGVLDRRISPYWLIPLGLVVIAAIAVFRFRNAGGKF